jgi:hypothetical protein
VLRHGGRHTKGMRYATLVTLSGVDHDRFHRD